MSLRAFVICLLVSVTVATAVSFTWDAVTKRHVKPQPGVHVVAAPVPVAAKEQPADDLRQEVERLRKALDDEREIRKAMQRELAIEKQNRRELSQDVDALRDLRRDLANRIEALEKKGK